MIVISDKLKAWLDEFPNRERAAEFLGCTRPWLDQVMTGANCGGDFIELVKNKAGWDFEKAFEIKEDHD